MANKYKTPSLALKLGHSLKKCCAVAICSSIKANDGEKRQSLEDFMYLCDKTWSTEVSSVNLSTLTSTHTHTHTHNRLIPIQFKHCFYSTATFFLPYSQEYNKSYTYVFINCHGFQSRFVFLLFHKTFCLFHYFTLPLLCFSIPEKMQPKKMHATLPKICDSEPLDKSSS